MGPVHPFARRLPASRPRRIRFELRGATSAWATFLATPGCDQLKPSRALTLMLVSQPMITCVVEYVIDAAKIDAFEQFARRWMELVDLHGGTHHGYFLPAEGASDKALALFSFPSLAAYERYRSRFGADPDFVADRIRDESGCVLRYQRSFMRPLLPGQQPD
jgi:hypothetical protein